MPISFLSPKSIFSKNKGSENAKQVKSKSATPPAPVDKDMNFEKNQPLPLPKLRTQNLSSGSEGSMSLDESPVSPTLNGKNQDFNRLSPLRPPKFDSASVTSSPGRRTLSDKAKSTPSSLVRQLRTYSNSMSTNDVCSSPSLSSHRSRHSLLSHNKTITETLPAELSPVVNLIHAQRLRTYAVGCFQVPGIVNGQKAWLEVEAKLTGDELAIWRPSDEDYTVDTGNDEFKPKYINLIDCHVRINAQQLEMTVMQDYNGNATLIKFETREELVKWSAAINLSNFEYISLNEAFTAVMLSLKGPKLSDVHILLSQKKRFPRFEWCNFRLPQISSKWVMLYVAIIPSDSKRNGCIEIYSTDKISKKHLVLYIPDASSVFNVYPEHANMIDFNSIMKLNGNIHINKQFEHLFVHSEGTPSSPSTKSHSRVGSSSSFSSATNGNPNLGSHSKNVSVSSTSSFFNNASSPRIKDSGPKSPKNATSSFFKKHMDSFVTTNFLYIMPIAHPGVSAIEIMIRNYIHIIDSFKLYGRPQQLNSDKSHIDSLLFSIPSLPHYQYLSVDEAMMVVEDNINRASAENWDEYSWRTVFKSFISKKFPNYKGLGNIYELYDGLELDANEIYNYAVESPRIQMPSGLRSQSNSLSNYDMRPEGFDNFSDNVISPSESNQNLNGALLGDPIEFGYTPENGNPNGNPDERTLEPILDMSQRDNIHPFQPLTHINREDNPVPVNQ